MLAKVQPFTPGLPEPLIDAPPSFTASFNPSPDPPATNQFFLTNGDGVSVFNRIVVDTDTTIRITLPEELDASFPTSESSPPPIVWSVAPDDPLEYSWTDKVFSFRVPAPLHVLHPWVFRFIVNVPGITGIRSQNIYIAKPLGASPEVSLQYGPDGNFLLVEDPDAPQVGIILGEELVLVNVHPTRSFTVNLVNAQPSTSISFPTAPESPIVWSSGETPDWVSGFSWTESTLSFTVGETSPAMGHSISLQFAIQVTPEGGEPTTVLSPDPILINTTIGDG